MGIPVQHRDYGQSSAGKKEDRPPEEKLSVPEPVKVPLINDISKRTDRNGEIMYDELTPSDIKKMEEEIEYRKLVVRPKALEDVKEARAHGDLSENFEYYAAKKYKNQNESRIRYLERMIRTAKVISENSAADEVGINNTVTVEFIDDGTQEDYKIVTTVRGNSLEGLISNESPLGKALLGKKVGDIVHVQVNANIEYDVEIKALKNTEDDGDKIRSF